MKCTSFLGPGKPDVMTTRPPDLFPGNLLFAPFTKDAKLLPALAHQALPQPRLPHRAALTALFNATDGANWSNNDNWLSNKPLDDR